MEDKTGPNGGHKRAEWRTALVPPSVYLHQFIYIIALAAPECRKRQGNPGAGIRKRNPRRCLRVFTLNVHEAYKRTPQDLESFFPTS